MPFGHGKNLVFKLDNAAGSLIALTSYVTDVKLDGSVDMGDTTTAGAENKTYVSGAADHDLSISGKLEDTATTGLDAHLSALEGLETTSTFEYGPMGSGAGRVKKSGECFMKGYKIGSPVGGVCEFTADFKISGAVTTGVWP